MALQMLDVGIADGAAPVSWRCCWAWCSPRCRAVAASGLVTVMAPIAAKAVTGSSTIALSRSKANGSCSLATSPN